MKNFLNFVDDCLDKKIAARSSEQCRYV